MRGEPGGVGKGKRVWRERGGHGGTGNGNARKNSPKTQHIWHGSVDAPWRLSPRACHTFSERSFMSNICLADSVPVC